MDIMDPSPSLLIIKINYGVILMMALGGQEWRTHFRKMWRAGGMTSWLKYATMFNKDFQPTSRYEIYDCVQSDHQSSTNKATSHISLNLADLLWWSGSSWNVVSDFYIPPIDKDVKQTEMFHVEVLNYKDGSRHQMSVYSLCSALLAMPLSNADVEQVSWLGFRVFECSSLIHGVALVHEDLLCNSPSYLTPCVIKLFMWDPNQCCL